MTSQRHGRLLRRSSVLGLFLLLGCDGASNSTRTGSESHFACQEHADCPDGRCENNFCVFDESEGDTATSSAQGDDQPDTDTVATESDPENTSSEAPSPAGSGGAPGSGGNAGLQASASSETTSNDSGSSGGSIASAGSSGNGGSIASAGGSGGQSSGGGENGNGGSAGSTATPAARIMFRIVNQTDVTVYLDGNRPVAGEDEAAGSQFAMEPLNCSLGCGELPPGGDCCLQCEQEWPRIVVLEPGASFDIRWDGYLFVSDAEACSACQCQHQLGVTAGSYAARVTAYAEAYCSLEPCGIEPDGRTGGAVPSGKTLDFRSPFLVPPASDLVVIEITSDPGSSGKRNGEDCELNSECDSNVCYSGEPMGGVLPQRTCNDCLTEFIYPSWCDEDADCCDGLRCGAGELAGLCVE